MMRLLVDSTMFWLHTFCRCCAPVMQIIEAGHPDVWSQLDKMLQAAAATHQVAEAQESLRSRGPCNAAEL